MAAHPVTESKLPGDEDCGRALDYLERSEIPWARACASLEAAEMEAKQAREIKFLEAEGSQGERASKANASGEVKLANKKIEEATFEKELLKARRARATILIEVWRSLTANRRAGIV